MVREVRSQFHSEMDKLCDKCRALASSCGPLRKNQNVYTKILLNQLDDHEHCVKVLLDAGADVNAKQFYECAIVHAVKHRHVKRLQALISAGADVNTHYNVVPSNIILGNYIKSQNVLGLAVSRGNIECMEILIKAGATINKLDHEGLLRLALKHDNVSCTDLLIKAGADVNGIYYTLLHTLIYSRPLYYAVTHGAKRCIELLLKAAADVNNAGISAGTVLMYVQDEECCKYLLKYHSQINRRDNNGDNALTSYIRIANPVNKDICSSLFAAGETVPQKIARWSPRYKVINAIDCLPQIKIYFYLRELCREAIRKHLLKLDPHTNLFDRIPRLGLPKPLTEYLLFYMSLDSASQLSTDAK